MKTVAKILVGLFVFSLSTTAFAASTTPAENGPSWVAHVEGMVCDFCAQGLLKALGKKDSVADIEVSLEDSTLTVHLHEKGALTEKELAKIIKDNGFSVSKITRPTTKS